MGELSTYTQACDNEKRLDLRYFVSGVVAAADVVERGWRYAEE